MTRHSTATASITSEQSASAPACRLIYLEQTSDCGCANPLASLNSLSTLSHPYHWHHVRNFAELEQLPAESDSRTLVVMDSASRESLAKIRDLFGEDSVVALITTKPFSYYGEFLADTASSRRGLDHIVAAHSQHSILRELKLVIDKTFAKDASLSLSDYFFPSLTMFQRHEIARGSQRQPINQAVQKFAESIGMNQMGCRNIFSICEELLMNVMIDAPREAEALGIAGRENIPAALRCGFDGSVFFICAEDPYGALRRETFYRYVGKTILRHNPEELLDSKADGAGIGIVKILSSCHGLFCRVKKGYSTEVMATIDSKEHLRDLGSMARSLHFYTD